MLPVPAAMFSLNVRTMLLLTPTAVAPSDGVDDDNVGETTSAVVKLSVVVSLMPA